MNDLTDTLRDAMTDHTDGLMLAPGAARTALHAAARKRHATVAIEAAAAVAVVGAGSGAAVVASHHGRSSTIKLQISTAGEGTHHVAKHARISYPKVMAQGKAAGAAGPSAALRGVGLPDPAPGFPLRRSDDSIDMTGMFNGTYWASTFLVGQTKPDCTSLPSNPVPTPTAGDDAGPSSNTGGTSCTPTGPEATVLVTEGNEPTAPDSSNRIEGDPVIATLVADGHPAYLTQGDNQKDLYFAAGKFAVLVAGFESTPDQIVTLADSIKGLD